MQLSHKEFEDRLAQKQLTIALIGMSGMGKSYRSKQLEDLGFATYGCDDVIAKNIAHLLSTEDVGGLATWMGQPYTEGYKDREQLYLNLEETITRDGINPTTVPGTVVGNSKSGSLASNSNSEARLPNSGNRVLDTTGSVIYCSPELQQNLKEKSLVVYLESNQEVRDKLFEVYMRDPKPVVWGDSFARQDGESDHDALKRCYPKLLEFRATRYKMLADVKLPFEIARNEASSGEKFLEEISNCLV